MSGGEFESPPGCRRQITVAEEPTAGWTLASVSCTGVSNQQNRGAQTSFTLAPGSAADCTFANILETPTTPALRTTPHRGTTRLHHPT